MKNKTEVLDLKISSKVYLKISFLLTILILIALFYIFPHYNPNPLKIKGVITTTLVPTNPIVNPVVPKPIPRPKIPVPSENPDEISNVLIPPDSTIFKRFGEQNPIEIPPPGTFIACETYPKLTYAPSPEYPKIAKMAGIEGKVFLQIFVGKDGKPKKVLVAKSELTADCDSAAVKTAWQFRFSPAMQRDKPIGVWVSMPIEFKLK